MLSSNHIEDTAKRVGFDICGVARARVLGEDREYAEWWLHEGMDGGLEYLHRNIEKRFSPDAFFAGARSVIVCGVNYRNSYSLGYPKEWKGAKIASYALSEDYHRIMGDMFHRLAAELGVEQYRVTVDSAPTAEKRWAVEAGLGRIGRNKLLITPQFGTFVMLGTLIVGDQADEYAEPLVGSLCGECHRCWESCPSGSLGAAGIDARRCVSRLTIEHGADTDADRHGWLFGCDECQSCCPYNKRPSIRGARPTLVPIFDPMTVTAAELSEIVPRTAMERSLRNI